MTDSASPATSSAAPLAAPPTVRLDQADSWLVEFEGRVLGTSSLGGKPSLILDRSAFYPEAGGQMSDRGTLAGHPVLDVQLDEHGVVHHLFERLPALTPGTVIDGVIDSYRRRVHMAQHTGQHMLSRALLDLAGAETVSSRLGETACTIDAGVEALSDRQLAEAEALVNRIIDDDLAVRAYLPDPDELELLPLRRRPKVDRNIRVVAIGGYDVSPCGGTHCTRSGQVSLVRVIATERYKGMTRVTFVAGDRGRKAVFESDALVRELARGFSGAPSELAQLIAKSQREQAQLRSALRELTSLAARGAATSLDANAGDGPIVGTVPGGNVELLRAVAGILVETPGRVALLATANDDGTNVIALRGSASSFDCGALVKRAAAATGGRGGGRPERAEGKLPADADWPAVVAQLLAG